MRGLGLVLGVLVRVVKHLGRRQVGVHPGRPGLLPELGPQVADGGLDGAPHRGQVGPDQPVLVLDHPPVHQDGVHVPALGLEGDVAVGVHQRERHRRGVVLDQHHVGLLPGLQAAQVVTAQGAGTAPGGPVDHVLGAQRVVGDGLALHMRLKVLAGPVSAEGGAHGGEQVAAPPHAGVHGQRDRDAMAADLPGGRVALPRALLRLGRHRDAAPGGRYALVGIGAQRGRVHVDVLRVHEPVLVHQPDAVVVGGAPHPGVGGDGQAQLAGHLERRLLRERRVACDVEGDLEPEHVIGGVPAEERPEGRVGGPLPRAGLDVAVGQDEPPGHRAQRVDGGLGVVGGMQVVRPVHRGGHACLEGLPGRDEVARADVLGAELPAVFQVVPDEVLGQRPVRAVGAHRRLPHMPVGVDHPRHHDAAARVDLERALRRRQARPHRGDPVAGHQHVRIGEDRVGVVHGEHRAAAQHHRAAVASPGGRRYLVGIRHRNLRVLSCGRSSATRPFGRPVPLSIIGVPAVKRFSLPAALTLTLTLQP